MIKKIKTFIKTKIKKILIATGIVGVALAAGTILTPDQILPDHLLKVPKEKILLSQEIDQIEYQDITTATGTDRIAINNKIVKYDYVSDKEVAQADYGTLKEDMNKRTGNTQFFKKGEIVVKGEKKEKWVAKVYTGMPFIKDTDGKWYQTETATTTIDAFQKQTKVSWLNKILGQDAIADTFYAGAGDGGLAVSLNTSWNAVHDATTQNNGNSGTVADGRVASSQFYSPNGYYYLYRGYLPVDTSALPDGAVISAATLNLYVLTTQDRNIATSYITVIQSTQPSLTGLGDADFDNWVLIDNPTKLSDDVDITGITTSAYNVWTLNAAGLAVISTTGNTWIGVRNGDDITDTSPLNGADIYDGMNIRFSEYTGTGSDPYLSVTYTVPVVTESDMFNIIFFE